MIIKAASVTHLTDARFFAAYGVDYIGFCFDPLSPDYISPQNALAIKGWINGPKIVAEFANQDVDNMKNIITFFEPDVIQVDAADPALSEIKKLNLPVILKTPAADLHVIENAGWLFVLTQQHNHEPFPAVQFDLMIDISERSDIPDDAHIKAVQLRGSAETEVGVKDYDSLADLIESIAGS